MTKKKVIIYAIVAFIILGAISDMISSCGSSSSGEKDNRSLVEMLDEYDFAAANKYVSRISTKDGYDIANYYLPAAIKTLKAEASFLMDDNDAEAERLFMLCANDVSGNIGNYQAQLGFSDGDTFYDTEHIIEQVTPYNQCMISIIREALIKDKPEFAKKVLKLMKNNYKCDKRLKEGKKGGYVYDYTYDYKEDNSQIEEAKKLIAEYEAAN